MFLFDFFLTTEHLWLKIRQKIEEVDAKMNELGHLENRFLRQIEKLVTAQDIGIRCLYMCPFLFFFLFQQNEQFNQLSQYDVDVTSVTAASSRCFVVRSTFCAPACCESSHCDINHVYQRSCHFEQWKIELKLKREWRQKGQGSTFFHLQRETSMFFNLQNLLSSKQVRISFHVFTLLLRLRLIKKATKPQNSLKLRRL